MTKLGKANKRVIGFRYLALGRYVQPINNAVVMSRSKHAGRKQASCSGKAPTDDDKRKIPYVNETGKTKATALTHLMKTALSQDISSFGEACDVLGLEALVPVSELFERDGGIRSDCLRPCKPMQAVRGGIEFKTASAAKGTWRPVPVDRWVTEFASHPHHLMPCDR